MRRFLGGFILICCLLGLLLACTNRPSEKEDLSLKIGLMPDIGMFPLLVAEEEGCFAQENLLVELISFKSAKERDAALQAGHLDGTMSDLLAVYFLNSNQFAVRATSITESRFLLMSAHNSGISSLKNLEDIPIGLSVNTVIEYIVDSILHTQGQEAEKLSVPQITVRMELLRTGELQAAALPDPLATVLTKFGAQILADSREMKIDPAVLIFTLETISKRKKALESFYRAYNTAVALINEDPERYRNLLWTEGRFPESVIDDIKIPYFRRAQIPDPTEVDQILAWIEKQGLKKADLTYSDLVVSGLWK